MEENPKETIVLNIEGDSIVKNGKILFLGAKDFKERIIYGSDCFICGAAKGSKVFNDEHVIPDWILRKYNLHNRRITLPNRSTFKYGQYKVPCCEDCNKELSQVFETPLSELLKLPYEELRDELTRDEEKVLLLFKWLTLIFFKTHLRSKEFNLHLDRRKGPGKITDNFDWTHAHHLHCLVRSHYTGAKINPNVFGSIAIIRAVQHESIENFDYCDNYWGTSVMLRMDGIAIICVLDDCFAIFNSMRHLTKKFAGRPLTPYQLKELFARFVFGNIHLKNRPTFHSDISPNGEYEIGVTLPEAVELVDEKDYVLSIGKILHSYIHGDYPQIENRETILTEIEEGKRGFLFNEQGEFIDWRDELNKPNAIW